MVYGQQLTFIDATILPEIEISGQKVKIHTQGLYVTADAWLVTGRLEFPPKRPLLIRIPRENSSHYEVLDLSAYIPQHANVKKAVLDHPGGFDRDRDNIFWIPISTSHRRGPTTILGIRIDPSMPLANGVKTVRAFPFADHLGAICCGEQHQLLAANWDTRKIYAIDSITGKANRDYNWETFANLANVHLAVQDWKFDPTRKLILASGIDKSLQRRSDDPNAVVAVVNLDQKTVNLIRVKPRDDVLRPLTNEGMAPYGSELFLLPEDFGRGAKILRYALSY